MGKDILRKAALTIVTMAETHQEADYSFEDQEEIYNWPHTY